MHKIRHKILYAQKHAQEFVMRKILCMFLHARAGGATARFRAAPTGGSGVEESPAVGGGAGGSPQKRAWDR